MRTSGARGSVVLATAMRGLAACDRFGAPGTPGQGQQPAFQQQYPQQQYPQPQYPNQQYPPYH